MINKYIRKILQTSLPDLSDTILRRCLHTTLRLDKVQASNLKGRSTSSQQWLARQLADPFVERAKMLNYRCRSAFKLLEIDEKCKILRPGQVILDCGAAPGSWTQIAVQMSNANGARSGRAKGFVVGIDLLQIYPIPGAHILGNTDFTASASQDKIRSILAGRSVDVVLSDMAPNATGVRALDHENITNLCYSVMRFAVLMSSPNASLLVKVWDNGDIPQLKRDMLRFYKSVKIIKPQASRADSSEKFLLAREFYGLKGVEKTGEGEDVVESEK